MYRKKRDNISLYTKTKPKNKQTNKQKENQIKHTHISYDIAEIADFLSFQMKKKYKKLQTSSSLCVDFTT